jgi:hypothetical protein
LKNRKFNAKFNVSESGRNDFLDESGNSNPLNVRFVNMEIKI